VRPTSVGRCFTEEGGITALLAFLGKPKGAEHAPLCHAVENPEADQSVLDTLSPTPEEEAAFTEQENEALAQQLEKDVRK